MAPKKSAHQSSPAAASPQSAKSSGITSSAASQPSKSNNKSSSTSSSSAASGGAGIRTVQDAEQIVIGVWNNYVDKTPQRVKLLDAFLLFLVIVGAVQFIYVVIVGNFPFNAFLSGFSACVGQIVLTASLRMQTNPENSSEFKEISHERAFADFVFGSMILHFFCVNFIN